MLCSSCCFCNVLKFQFISCFASYVGAVAPVIPVQGPLQLVLLVINAFLTIFTLFVGL